MSDVRQIKDSHTDVTSLYTLSLLQIPESTKLYTLPLLQIEDSTSDIAKRCYSNTPCGFSSQRDVRECQMSGLCQMSGMCEI